MWKYLNESQAGTSHVAAGLECQDASFVTPYRTGDSDLLILACADGAGSAQAAKVGAEHSCSEVIDNVVSFFQSGRTLDEISRDDVVNWARQIRTSLLGVADMQEIQIRDLACTLLFAIVGRDRAVFAQIGDGAIVMQDAGEYRPVFWPQSGEYQNTTYFITDVEFEQNLQIEIMESTISELALFTDGLQMLALNYSTKSAHGPFFKPMFETLRQAVEPNDLVVPFRQFLDSKGVNDRTDDDKTLILATRNPGPDAIV